MAKKPDNEPSTETTAAATMRRRYLRYCLVLLLAGAAVLAWISLLSFSPTDPPSRVVYPPRTVVDNAAGLVGAYVGYTLRYWLGGGAYMGLLFVSVAALVMMLGGRITDLPWRIIGLALLVTATSAGVYLLNPVGGEDVSKGLCGIVGTATGRFLMSTFSTCAWLIVILSFCIGLMLAADNLVLRIPRLGKKVWAKRGRLSGTTGALRRGTPQLVTVGTRDVGASPRAVVAAPTAPGRASMTRDKSAAPRPGELSRPPAPKVHAPTNRPTHKLPTPTGSDQDYIFPSMDLLAEPTNGYMESQEAQAEEKRAILQQTLSDFSVDAEVISYMTGPVITLFELTVAPGVKVSQISNLAKDIARALAVPGVRIVSPMPGKDTIGIEVPNLDKEIVRLKELMDMAPHAHERMYLPLYLGKDAGGNAIIADLSDMPHLLIAGTTGSGKSVCINSMIMATLMKRTPEQVGLILVDPKMVEMAAFETIPHLLCPIINDVRKAEEILEWAATKMDERYELLKEANVKNVAGYNRLSKQELYKRFDVRSDEERKHIPLRMQHYVIIIDELADLIMTSNKDVENHIIRIAQKARAVGIHLILATQRPSVNVVTGLIKSNMPCRISFRVASRQESRIVLDQNGAEVLLGRGDMLFLQPGTSNLIRAQGTYVDESEIRSVVQELRSRSHPQYSAELMRLQSRPSGTEPGERDELFDQGVEIVLATQRGSVSLLQRRLSIGYSRASRVIDQMADAGILGDYKGSQARECMMSLEEWEGFRASIAADQSGKSAANGEPTSV